MNENEILCYGQYITDDDMNVFNTKTKEYEWVRIRIISYEGNLYYYKMVNGECIECKLIGRSL